MRFDLAEFAVTCLVNIAVILLPWREGERLSNWELHWQRCRRAANARRHIQKSAPPPGEPGCEHEARRQEALMALWRQLQVHHRDHVT